MTLAAVKREPCAWPCVASLKQGLVPDAQGHSRVVPEVPGFRLLLHKLRGSSCLPVAPLIVQMYVFLQDLLKLGDSSWMVSSARTQGNYRQILQVTLFS